MAAKNAYLDILQTLKKGEYAPLYLFHGEESYFIDELARYIEHHALSEADQAFNQMVVYGRDVDATALRDMASRVPMMAPRQVIIVREAQDMKTLPDLEGYVQRPVPTTVLVLCHKNKKIDGRSKMAKALLQQGVVFESKPLYENQVPAWITEWCRHQGYPITPEAVAVLTEYLGNQLGTLINEINKIILNLELEKIEPGHIQDAIGISREYNVFELQKALGLRQVAQVYRILHFMAQDQKSNPAVAVISSLAGYFLKLYQINKMRGASDKELMSATGVMVPMFFQEYKQAAIRYKTPQLERIFGLMHEFDLRSKGVQNRSQDSAALLQELIHEILHA
ncbi:MAG: DNA polymerase III subunit delta [Saprospiraceae bacterium]|nr:DNA polymerase III subunit delta [Saprospiraceae bacterium]